jgi:hypothetical protein
MLTKDISTRISITIFIYLDVQSLSKKHNRDNAIYIDITMRDNLRSPAMAMNAENNTIANIPGRYPVLLVSNCFGFA